MKNFHERLIDLQTSRNLLKKNIAKAVGVSVMAYYRYETNQRVPDLNVLLALADYFNVSIDYLCGRTDNPEINK